MRWRTRIVVGIAAAATAILAWIGNFLSVQGSEAYSAAQSWAATSTEVQRALGGKPLGISLSWRRFDSKRSADGEMLQFGLNVASIDKGALLVVRVDNYTGEWKVRTAELVEAGQITRLYPHASD